VIHTIKITISHQIQLGQYFEYYLDNTSKLDRTSIMNTAS